LLLFYRELSNIHKIQVTTKYDSSKKAYVIDLSDESTISDWSHKKNLKYSDFIFTNLSGQTQFLLPLGILAFKETKAPTGYTSNNSSAKVWNIYTDEISNISSLSKKQYVTLTQEDSNKVVANNSLEDWAIAIYENSIKGGVSFQKLDSDRDTNNSQPYASLKGAEITIYNNSANSVYVDGKKYKVGEAVLSLATDETGLATYKFAIIYLVMKRNNNYNNPTTLINALGFFKYYYFRLMAILKKNYINEWDQYLISEDGVHEFVHKYINDSPSMYDENGLTWQYIACTSGSTINDCLRYGGLNNNVARIIKQADEGIAKIQIKKDVVVFRDYTEYNFINAVKCAKNDEDADVLEPSFLQTKLVKTTQKHGNVNLKIYVPMGTNGIYYGDVCGEEKIYFELTFKRKRKLKIVSIDDEYINCILING